MVFGLWFVACGGDVTVAVRMMLMMLMLILIIYSHESWMMLVMMMTTASTITTTMSDEDQGGRGFVFFLASLVPFPSLCVEFGSKLWICLVCKFFLIPWKYFFGS